MHIKVERASINDIGQICRARDLMDGDWVYIVTTTEIGQKEERALWERGRAAKFRILGIYRKDIQVEVFRGKSDIQVRDVDLIFAMQCGM